MAFHTAGPLIFAAASADSASPPAPLPLLLSAISPLTPPSCWLRYTPITPPLPLIADTLPS